MPPSWIKLKSWTHPWDLGDPVVVSVYDQYDYEESSVSSPYHQQSTTSSSLSIILRLVIANQELGARAFLQILPYISARSHSASWESTCGSSCRLYTFRAAIDRSSSIARVPQENVCRRHGYKRQHAACFNGHLVCTFADQVHNKDRSPGKNSQVYSVSLRIGLAQLFETRNGRPGPVWVRTAKESSAQN